MSLVARAPVRGSCPGARRPMESGDGLIVRVRPHAGRLQLDVAARLADAAARFGNGEIDLTRRANLQLRGVTPETLGPLQSALDALRLLDASADAEAARNIIVSPLAGVDPGEVIDVTPLALDLEARLTADRRLWNLPVKFGFVVDGGGALSLDNERGDIWLKAISESAVAVGLDAADGVHWLGSASVAEAVDVAVRVAFAFIAARPAGSRLRMRDLEPAVLEALAIPPPLWGRLGGGDSRSLAGRDSPHPWPLPTRGRGIESNKLGVLRHEGRVFAVGLGAPFGRVTHGMLRALCDAASKAGADELRVSPWRSFYVPVSDALQVDALIEVARGLGFLTDATDPLAQIDACPGAPACRSASGDTRAIARRVAALMPRLGDVGRVHVSGCAKGCACSDARPLALVCAGNRVAVIRNGRADSAPSFFISAADIERLPDFLKQESHL